MTYQITDTITNETTTTDDLREGLRACFPCTRDDAVFSAIDGLVDALNRGEYIGGYEAYLGVEVTTI